MCKSLIFSNSFCKKFTPDIRYYEYLEEIPLNLKENQLYQNLFTAVSKQPVSKETFKRRQRYLYLFLSHAGGPKLERYAYKMI